MMNNYVRKPCAEHPTAINGWANEFAFRLNEGNVKIHTLDRLDSFVDGMADKRLTYAGLIQ